MLLIVHGGAGDRKPSKKALKKISESLSSGYRVLSAGGPALEAVITSITVLENSGIFNAGAGGNLQMDGKRRLDASLMDGENLKTGSVIGLEGILNPIVVSRLIMDLPNTMLTNTGAGRIAAFNKLDRLPEPGPEELSRLEKHKNKGTGIAEIYKKLFSTVGSVAADNKGNLAAGSSTGGISSMLPGRVGDTPVIGAGIYAENSRGAVACTGRGEDILRLALAKEICMRMDDLSPSRAASLSLKRLLAFQGSAGVIVLDARGRFAILHTTEYMASGYINERRTEVKEYFRKIKRSV